MSEQAKDLVQRFYREAIVERDATACERLLSEDFVHNAGAGQAIESPRPRCCGFATG